MCWEPLPYILNSSDTDFFLRELPAQGWWGVLPVLLCGQLWSCQRSQHPILLSKPSRSKPWLQLGEGPVSHNNTGTSLLEVKVCRIFLLSASYLKYNINTNWPKKSLIACPLWVGAGRKDGEGERRLCERDQVFKRNKYDPENGVGWKTTRDQPSQG